MKKLHLDPSEIRSLIRRFGEIAMASATLRERRTALMNVLCEASAADGWLWFAATCGGDCAPPSCKLAGSGGGREGGAALSAGDIPPVASLADLLFRELPEPNSERILLREDLEPGGPFARSGGGVIWQEAGIDPMILSARRLSATRLSMLGLYRRSGTAAHSSQSSRGSRGSRIAHILLTELSALHQSEDTCVQDAVISALPPRLQGVFSCLMQGCSRKEIADRLGLSIHTVGEYVSELYRRFQVNSQTGLLVRLLANERPIPPTSGASSPAQR